MTREKIVFQAENVETVTENIEEQISETARENSQTENGVYVKGMALPFGRVSRNGVQYEKESVKEAAEDLVGRPILFNHKQDYSTGHILNIEVTDEGMFYEGDINPNAEMPNGVTVAEAVERGDIRSPSIQAFVEQLGEPADEDAVINDMETEKVAVADFIEISMVTVPGFPQASAMPEHLQRQGVKPVTEIVGSEETEKENTDDRKGEPFAGYDNFEDCVEDNQDKDDPEAYCGELKDRAEELEQEEDDTMSNNEEQEDDGSAENGENQEQVTGQNFVEFVASHMEGADVADVTDALEDFEFTGIDLREVAALLGQEFNVETGEVLEVLEQLQDASENVSAEQAVDVDSVMSVVERHMEAMLEDLEGMEPVDVDDEEEGTYGDMDDEDEDEEEDESTGEDNDNGKDKEELKEKVEEQKEKINKLEERLDKLVDEDTGKSRQEKPEPRKPSKVKNRGIFT